MTCHHIHMVSIVTVFTTVNTKVYSNYLFDFHLLTKSSVCTCFTKLSALNETKLNCYIWKRCKITLRAGAQHAKYVALEPIFILN